jgi:hypothetical protein
MRMSPDRSRTLDVGCPDRLTETASGMLNVEGSARSTHPEELQVTNKLIISGATAF